MKYSAIPAAADDPNPANEAQFIRDRLHHLMRELDEMASAVAPMGNRPTLDRVRAILKVRRMRDRFFPADIFADPAWDMLLELYTTELGQYRTSVSSLCIGSAVPATTALRWIKSLEQRGLVTRAADPNDGRRFFVALTDSALNAMHSLFCAIPEMEPLL